MFFVQPQNAIEDRVSLLARGAIVVPKMQQKITLGKHAVQWGEHVCDHNERQSDSVRIEGAVNKQQKSLIWSY